MNAARKVEAHRHWQLFLGAGVGERLADIEQGVRRVAGLLNDIRPEDRGADQRAESLAAHLDALSRQTMKLAQRIRLENAGGSKDA